MNAISLWLHIFVVALLGFAQFAEAEERCPRTIGAENVFSEPWPQSETWFGSESLAVILPEKGFWPTTAEGHLIAVKLFWYIADFQPGMESDFVGRIERIDDGPNDATISASTNAGLANDVWTVLTGVDFNSAGCWRITGEYRRNSLDFVVETVPGTEIMNRRQDGE